VGALPPALKEAGVDVRVICPLHRGSLDGLQSKRISGQLSIRIGDRLCFPRLVETRLPGTDVPVYLIEHKGFFDRPDIYAGPKGDFPDNAERSFVICRSAIDLSRLVGWTPDVYHAHDWMAAALPACLNAIPTTKGEVRAASVLTIHNLEHQGSFSPEKFEVSNLPQSYFQMEGFEHFGRLNLLKGGIQHADKITTVSPTYAEEVRTEPHGHGLDSSLVYRAADLVGILNGMDEEAWNPDQDSALPHPFSLDTVEAGKKGCRKALSKELNLPYKPSLPLLGAVSRLYWQKGLDALADALPKLLEKNDFQLALLGSGDPVQEQAFTNLANRFPDRVSIHIGFDDGLARRIFAGTDFFLMPSRFEPCGLAQQYAMRYGSLPIANSTGGLVDTIKDLKKHPRSANGLLMADIKEASLNTAFRNACEIFAEEKKLQLMRRNAMMREASWKEPAESYAEVYKWAMERSGINPKAVCA
jgi:starch synthase